VVWQGDDAAERVHSGRAVADKLEAKEKGVNCSQKVLDVC
jgi:hypothetical protein